MSSANNKLIRRITELTEEVSSLFVLLLFGGIVVIGILLAKWLSNCG